MVSHLWQQGTSRAQPCTVLFTKNVLSVNNLKVLIGYDSSPVGFIQLCFLTSVIGYTELQEGEGLSVATDMSTIVKTMAAPDSGLDIRDRMWLKITIPNAFIGKVTTAPYDCSSSFVLKCILQWFISWVFISLYTLLFSGSDVVDWLYSHVEGFQDRRDARKYACNLLKVLSNLCFNTVTGFFHQILSRDANFEENLS